MLEDFFLLFRTIPTDTKEQAGCWGSEAGAQDAASRSLFVALQSLVCLHSSVTHILGHGTGWKQGGSSIKQTAAEQRQEELEELSQSCLPLGSLV